MFASLSQPPPPESGQPWHSQSKQCGLDFLTAPVFTTASIMLVCFQLRLTGLEEVLPPSQPLPNLPLTRAQPLCSYLGLILKEWEASECAALRVYHIGSEYFKVMGENGFT